MAENAAAPLLVEYLEAFRRGDDLEAFRRNVEARYTEGTLCRILRSGRPEARRASVLALGLFGTFESNRAVGESLKDPDPIVRNQATQALWSIWFRADTPDHNAQLAEVRALIGRNRAREAEAAATRLIDRAPGFAEAYNQRAIARFALGKFAECAGDCRMVLQKNRYHFGALDGLTRCYLELGQRPEALETCRRALKLQPYNDGLRQLVAILEAE
ncbi:MAG: HEAT repeat domain-containing protein [Isosphaeraceae bacterium]